jgi:hypothetical protein
MMTTAEIHSRTSSRQSQLEMPVDNFYSKPTMHDSCSQDNFMISTRRGSHSLANEPIFIGRNELEQLRRQHGNAINPYEFETHSLPRRTCIHHQQEEQYHTHSLPRREHHHHYLEHSAKTNNATVEQILEKRRLSNAASVSGSSSIIGHPQDSHSPQPSYVNVNSVADTYSLSRRSSSSSHQHHQQQQVPSLAITTASQQHQSSASSHQKHHQALQQVPPNDEMCSTCSSETQTESETEDDENEDGENSQEEEGEEEEELSCDEEEGSQEEEEEEKEIFIDFKPNLSPTQPKADLTANAATVKKNKKLIKAMSEGEILLENIEIDKQKATSASEDDLQQQQNLQQKSYAENLYYNNTPIRDEDIFKALSSAAIATDQTNTAATSSSSSTLNRYCRETFRKRSVSLEDPLADEAEIVKKVSKNLKADGSSPGSLCASTDDVTRDHSEGNWNDSQITVLPLPPLPIM